MRLLPLLLLAAACAGPKDSVPTPTTPTTPVTGCDGAESGVITLETRDGLSLEADWLPPPSCGAPGVVLLHMIPPSNDRTNWPRSFRRALNEAGFGVISVDRR